MLGNIVSFKYNFDKTGALTVIDPLDGVPIIPHRVFFVHRPVGLRGRHAHKKTTEIVFPIAGHFELFLDDGTEFESHHLDSPNTGILIPPMIWIELSNFSIDCIYMAITDTSFNENDYIRDRGEYLDSKI